MTSGARTPAARGLRQLLWGRGVGAVGDGMWFTVWAVFFTRVLDLSTTRVGLGMGLAAAVGLAVAVPLGALGDRLDPGRLLGGLTLVRSVAMAAYLLVDGTVAFLAVTVVFVALANASSALRTTVSLANSIPVLCRSRPRMASREKPRRPQWKSPHAYPRWTVTIQFSVLHTEPHHCRWTPGVLSPFLTSLVSSMMPME